MQSLNGKSTGDSLTASEWNQVPSELQNIITGTGQTLTSADLNQLGKGVAGYVATADVYTSSGVADAYVLSPISGYQGPTSYFDGMRVRFIPNVANTGGSVTVNVNGLGVRTVVREDGAVNSANTEYQVGTMVELRYDDAVSNFKLRRIPNAGLSTNQFGLMRIATQAETDTGTSNTLAVTPATFNGKTATETRRGVTEIATQAEVNAGTDDFRYVTSVKLRDRLALLGSDDIDNESTVTGTTVSDALNTLDAAATGGIQVVFKTADQSNGTGSFANVTDLNNTLSLVSGQNYAFEAFITIFGGSPATSGIRLRFSQASANANYEFIYRQESNNDFIGKDAGGATVDLIITDAEMPNVVPDRGMLIHGFISASSTQNLTVQFQRDNSSGTVTIRQGSWIKLTRV